MSRSPAADRLNRLRWLLTLLFTVTNAVGLIVFAWLAIQSHQERGQQQLDDSLRVVVQVTLRLLQDENGAPTTAFISADQISTQCPQFYVMPGGAGIGQFPAVLYRSRTPCVNVDEKALAGYANKAAELGTGFSEDIQAGDGGYARMRVTPYKNTDGQYVGSVVAVADEQQTLDAHNEFVLYIVIACVLLVTGLGSAGYFLATRLIRPAAKALEQQEILLAETAHDLRTPVAALRALAETAMRNPGQSHELLPRTVNLAARMGRIIDGLLMRARLAANVDRLDIQPVWLDQLVTGLVEDTPTDGARVTVTAAPTLVHVDPNLTQRAIGNLVDNALRYGRQPNAHAIVHVTVGGGRVVVSDQGPGIDSALADDVLDRFKTSGSTGLGLSIVRWVAQAHGGTLQVYNAEEGGAIFELAFPVPAQQ